MSEVSGSGVGSFLVCTLKRLLKLVVIWGSGSVGSIPMALQLRRSPSSDDSHGGLIVQVCRLDVIGLSFSLRRGGERFRQLSFCYDFERLLTSL